jgi:Ca2+-binding RTX toxin-like protein
MAFNLLQQMEMLEDMVLNGASASSVISIGWNGVGSGSSDDSGSGSQDDGGLSDEEFQQANAEVMAQLFENINVLIAQGGVGDGYDSAVADLVFDTLFGGLTGSGTGGSGSGGTDGGTSGGGNQIGVLRDYDPFGLPRGGSAWKPPVDWKSANPNIRNLQLNDYTGLLNGQPYYTLHRNTANGQWELTFLGDPPVRVGLVRGRDGNYYWALPDEDGKFSKPCYKISLTVHDQTGDHTVDFIAGSSDDVLSGSGWIDGDDGNDAITGSAKDDVLKGGSGNDWLAGLGGDDVVNGGTGNDIAGGQDGDDKVSGGTGDDQVWGGLGDDHLTGDSGHDWLAGEAGNDTVEGGDGDDIVSGQEGADTLLGGAGNDELWGGAGADRFFFTTALNAAGNVDQIKDFSAAEGDKILLKHEIFSGLPMGFLSSYLFTVGAAATPADQRIVYDQNTGALSYDADGSGSQAAIQFAKLSAGTYLTAYQFTVV